MSLSKHQIAQYFEGSSSHLANNLKHFNDSEKKHWKGRFTDSQAVVGGLRGTQQPVILYKAPCKRVTSYAKEIFSLETGGVNRLGNYFLSKHLFNLSFLQDPFLQRNDGSSQVSLETIYQLGNYHRLHREGLFLQPLLICTSSTLLEQYGWETLQGVIDDLTNDVEISLPRKLLRHGNDEDEGWFYPLLPPSGRRPPFPDVSFVQDVFDQLVKNGYLEKAIEPCGETRYRIKTNQADGNSVSPTDDWNFGFGRNTRLSEWKTENSFFLEVILKDIVLQKNSSNYFGPLKIFCYGCGRPTFYQPHPYTPLEDVMELNWYDLNLEDPRSEMVKSDEHQFCHTCEQGEYICNFGLSLFSQYFKIMNEDKGW